MIDTDDLDRIRGHFAALLVVLSWFHVPLLAAVATINDRPAAPAVIVDIVLAAILTLSWWRSGIAPVTRYVSAVVLMAQPACCSSCSAVIPGRWTCTCTSSPCWRC